MDENQIMMMLRGGAQVNEQAAPQFSQPQQQQMSMFNPAGSGPPQQMPTNQPDYMIADSSLPGTPQQATPNDFVPSWMGGPQQAQPQQQAAAQQKPTAQPTQWVNKLPPAQVGKHINEMQSYLSQYGTQLPPEQKAKLSGDLELFIYQQLTPQERSFFPGLTPQQRLGTWKPLGSTPKGAK